MKKCPFCAEDIQDAAVVCKHCSRELTAAPSKPTATTPPADTSLNRKLGGKELFGYLAIGIGALMTIASSSTAGFGFFAMWIGLGLTLGGGAVVRWGGGFIAALIMMAIGMSMGGNRYGSSTTTSAAPRTPTSAAAPAPAPTPQLELLSSRGFDEHGFHQVEGEVKNISSESMKNVAVVVTWYTKSDQLVKSDETLIQFNPILPGQTSPFKSLTSSNPEMTNYRVSFKTLFGGTLRTKDSRRN